MSNFADHLTVYKLNRLKIVYRKETKCLQCATYCVYNVLEIPHIDILRLNETKK